MIRSMGHELAAVVALCMGFSSGAQSFTQTSGGQSAQDGVGAMVVGSGYAVAVRDRDPGAQRHVGTIYAMNGSGGFQSANALALTEPAFLQGLVNAADGSAFVLGSILPANDPADHDGLLVKLSNSGAVVWTVHPTVNGSQQYFNGTALPDGGIVVCGVEENGNGHDALITRFDAGGNVVWSHTGPGTTDAEAYGIAATSSDLIITGRQRTFGGHDDALLMRLDLSGNVVWTTTSGGPRNEQSRAVVNAGNGTFISAGWTNSVGAFDVSTQRIPDHVHLIAFDLDGDTLWTRAFGDTIFDREAHAMGLAPNGDLFVVGQRAALFLSDALVMRVSASGTLLWQRSIDLGEEDRLLHVLPLTDGVVSTGWSFGPFGRQLLFIRRNADGF